MDTETLILIHKEESNYRKEVAAKKNQILSLTNSARKQKEWSELFPKMNLALSGLNREQLEDINNMVY